MQNSFKFDKNDKKSQKIILKNAYDANICLTDLTYLFPLENTKPTHIFKMYTFNIISILLNKNLSYI